MTRLLQIGILCVLLAVFLVGIALLPAKPPAAATTPVPATTAPTPAAGLPTLPAGVNSQIATAAANPQIATALAGVDRNKLGTAAAGIDRNQLATSVAVTGLLETGPCLNIKGVVMPDGAKIYYLPTSYYYEGTKVDTAKGDRYFCSAPEALVAGFTPGK